MNENGRWSRIKFRGRFDPNERQDALKRAKQELGPFRLEHSDVLLHLCPCERCVEKLIVDIATRFNERALLIENAPRKKTLVENLRRVSEAVSNLADTLVDLDDYTREYLGVLDVLDQPIARAYEAAAADKLPKPDTAQETGADGGWVETLRALKRYISVRMQMIGNAGAPEARVDKGGNTNVVKEKFGPLAAYLVRLCWTAFENCRSGEATASENGRFVRFVNCVYEYATGETEENSTVLHWIKKLAKPLRWHDALLQEYSSLENRRDELKAHPQTPERDAEIAELEDELSYAARVVVDALMATSPNHLKKNS